MSKIYYILIIVQVFSSIVYSQTVTIKDAGTGNPLELVTLISKEPAASALTNKEGRADISSFKGSAGIEISLLGYERKTLSFNQIKSLSFTVNLVKADINLDAVVVSATRWKQISGDIPSKVINISNREITLQNPQTAADLLGVSGKVYIQKSQQGGGSPMIRGFATNRLLYTVDGVRMNTAIFRAGNIQNVISLDPFATEKTEVLFGPSSVIYGSDAIGGVMSFQTLTPQLSANGETFVTGSAAARYSSANNEQTGHFDINLGWEKWAFVTSISSFDYDNLRQGSHGPEDYLKPYYVQRVDSVDRVVTQDDPLLQIPSAYSQTNIMQKIRFQPEDDMEFQYGFHYSETSPYGRYDRNTRQKNGTARYAEWYYGPQKWMMHHLGAEHDESNFLYDKVSVQFAFQKFEESRIDRSLNKAERAIRVEKVDAYSVNMDMIKKLSKENTLYYGAEYVLNEVKSTGTDEDIVTGISVEGPARYPQSTWKSLAVYLNDQHKLSEKVIIQGGIRYNAYMLDAKFDTRFYPFPFTKAEINSGSVTGSAGLVYRPAEDWVISGNLSTAFRSPNVDDIGKVFDSEAGSVVVPNPDLEAEYAYNADLGIAKTFGDIVKIDVTGYYTYLDNAMVRRDFKLGGLDSIMYDGTMSKVQAIQNAASAYVYGLQAGLEVKLPSGFGFSSDLNYQKGEEELDDGTKSPSRHAAPAFGVSRLFYRNEKSSIEFYAVYQDERKHSDLAEEEKGKDEIYAADAQGETYSPGWYTLNLKCSYALTDLITINAGMENITDRRYRPYSSGISGPGRNFVFSLKTGF